MVGLRRASSPRSRHLDYLRWIQTRLCWFQRRPFGTSWGAYELASCRPQGCEARHSLGYLNIGTARCGQTKEVVLFVGLQGHRCPPKMKTNSQGESGCQAPEASEPRRGQAGTAGDLPQGPNFRRPLKYVKPLRLCRAGKIKPSRLFATGRRRRVGVSFGRERGSTASQLQVRR